MEVEERPRRASTLHVLLLLVAASAVISFLASYAAADVLVRSEVIPRWADGSDPRPKWMAMGFCVLLGAFATIGAIARQSSRGELKRIDAMLE